MYKVNPFITLLAVFVLVTSISACSVFSGRVTPGEYVDDTTITAKVKDHIFENPTLKVMQIHVETFQGAVQLSGFVDSENAKDTAEDIARHVSGVKSVRNDIVVR